MYIFVFFWFVLLSISYSWLPDSLFLLGTGGFIWCTTSCRSCHRIFLPDFHRFSECVFLVAEYWDTVLEWQCWFSIMLDMYLPVFLVLLVCVRVCVCVTVCTGRQTDAVERIAKLYQHTRGACTHTETTRTPLSCGGDECDTDFLSLRMHIYIHRHRSMHVCLFAFLSIPDSWMSLHDSCLT